MYKEILELEKYCDDIGVETRKETLLDGYVLRFNNGGDVVQHQGSYGGKAGCVEFGYTGFEEVDFKATLLEKAKEFVAEHKYELNEVAE